MLGWKVEATGKAHWLQEVRKLGAGTQKNGPWATTDDGSQCL